MNKISETDPEEYSRFMTLNNYSENFKDFEIDSSFGASSKPTSNYLFLDPEHVVHYSGMVWRVVNIDMRTVKCFSSRDGGGIGAIAVNKGKQIVAVAESGHKPSIYFYQHPEYETINQLKGGTERSYCSIAFSSDGSRLASVGSYPDFSLVIWDWKENAALLRVKAFSQEIYNVSFSRYSNSSLCTSGLAHIKFWKVSNTFTGLKLKGEVGKFGSVELSDIRDMAMLSDGNTISGSENGYLLLWEGGVIKSIISETEGRKCHNGPVTVVRILGGAVLMTASCSESKIKLWSKKAFLDVEQGENQRTELPCLYSIDIGSSEGIMSVDEGFKNQGVFLVTTTRGRLLRVEISDVQKFTWETLSLVTGLKNNKCEIVELESYPIGELMAVDLSNDKIFFGGDEGSLKVISTIDKSYQRIHQLDDVSITSLLVLDDSKILVGLNSGVLQVYNLEDWRLEDTKRVFQRGIQGLCKGSHSEVICWNQSEVFVVRVLDSGLLEPVFVLKVSFSITTLVVSGERIVFGNSIGEVRSMRYQLREGERHDVDEDYSLKTTIDPKIGKLQMLEIQKPKVDEEDINFLISDKKEKVDVEWESKAVKSMICVDGLDNELTVLISSEGEFTGYLYEIRLSSCSQDRLMGIEYWNGVVERSINYFTTRHVVVTLLKRESEYLLMGYSDGLVVFRSWSRKGDDVFKVRSHFQDNGRVFFIKMINSFSFVSAATDNCLVVLKKFNGEVQESDYKMAINQDWDVSNLLDEESRERLKKIERGYSLQQEKMQSLKDQEMEVADRIKVMVKESVCSIKLKFEEILRENSALPERLKLSSETLVFDAQQEKALSEKYNEVIEETEKELRYEVSLSRRRLEKLNEYLTGDCAFVNTCIRKIGTSDSVSTFKTRKLQNYHLNDLTESLLRIDERVRKQWREVGVCETESQDSRAFIEVLKEIRKKMQDEKNVNHYNNYKERIKEECVHKETLEELQKYKNEILQKVEVDRKEVEEGIRVDEETDFGELRLKVEKDIRVEASDLIGVEKFISLIRTNEAEVLRAKQEFNNSLLEKIRRRAAIVNFVRESFERIEEIGMRLEGVEVVDEDTTRKLEFIKSVFDVEGRSPTIELESKAPEENCEEWQELIGSQETEDLKKRLGLNDFKGSESERMSKGPLKSSSNETVSLSSSQVISVIDQLSICVVDFRAKRKVNKGNSKLGKKLSIEFVKLQSERAIIVRRVVEKINTFNKEVDELTFQKCRVHLDAQILDTRTLELYKELLEISLFEEEDRELIRSLEEKEALLKGWEDQKTLALVEFETISVKIKNLNLELKKMIESYRERVFPSEPEKADFVYQYFSYTYVKSKSREKEESPSGEENRDFDPNSMDADKKDAVLYFEQNEEWVEAFKSRFETEETLKVLQRQSGIFNNEIKKINEKIHFFHDTIDELMESLADLQNTKFDRLRKLKACFFVSLSSIHVDRFESGVFDEQVLIENTKIEDLKLKALKLFDEGEEIEQDTKQLKYSKDSLILNINILRQCLKRSKEELDENFKLKFGEVVDLRILENMKETPKVAELKREYRDTELSCKKRIEEAKKMLNQSKEKLLEYKRQNTEIIKKITQLGNNQIKLNKTLDSTNKQIFKDEKDVDQENSNRNHKDLIKVIGLLNSELDELKKEIISLKEK